MHFMQYLIAFCKQLEIASDIISDRFMRLLVLGECVKLCNPHLNCSGEIRPKAIGDSILDIFAAIASDQK